MARYCFGSLSEYDENHGSPSGHAEHRSDRAVRPTDFSYKHKAERAINLVLTPLSESVDESVPDGLRAALDASPAGAYPHVQPLLCESIMRVPGQLPITSLFSTFLNLHNTERLKKSLEQILGILKSGVDEEPIVPDVSHPSDPFQRHFATLLCWDQQLGRLRMKLCVADFCWVCSPYLEKRRSG